jgi:hypothetical protein
MTSLAAAIRARPPSPPARPVWIFVADDPPRWCVLRTAHAGGLVTTLCCADLPPEAVHVSTARPYNACPACRSELEAGTPGAATAVSRAATRNLRRPNRGEP